jgi:murein DD-endopeptidase MepM/ murein hydrolase activator NlpD
MLNRTIKNQRKKFLAVITIIFVCVLAFSSYANASYEVQRPITDNGGKINQGYLWGESTTVNGTPVSHKGIDFSYATGTNVHAVTNGTVVELKEDREDGERVSTWGNYILIRHSTRHYDRADQTPQWTYVYSLYIHLKKNSIVPSVGNTVTAGQQIAQSDNTGTYSTGVAGHLNVV